MPEMPRGINDSPRPYQTWAAPRDGGAIRRHIGGGSTGETSESESFSEDNGVDRGRGGGIEDEVRHMRTMPVAKSLEEERQEEFARPRPATMHGARQGKIFFSFLFL